MPAEQTRKTPERRCVGCGEKKPKKELVRVIRTPEGEIKLDATGKAAGRGAYICPDAVCLRKAQKQRRLESNLSAQIPDEIYKKLERQLKNDEIR